MDLTQTKLTKAEWISIEIPESEKEKEILQLIQDGFHNFHVHRNTTPTLASMSKMDVTPQMQDHLYRHYLEPIMDPLLHKHGLTLQSIDASRKSPLMKSKDLIRMKSMDRNIDDHRNHIYEFVVLEFCRQALEGCTFHVYTLLQLQKAHIPQVHPKVTEFVKCVLDAKHILPSKFLHHAYECIEKNPNLFKFADKTLFEHQKQLFHLFQLFHLIVGFQQLQ
jgi:hypothetical protein